jgi:periplasmic protein TonB
MMAARHCHAHDIARWFACALVAIVAHAGVAFALIPPEIEMDDADESGGFVIELAEQSVSKPDTPLDVALGPDQIQSPASIESHAEKHAESTEEKPEPKPDEEQQVLPAVRDAETVLPVTVKETKEEEKPESQAQNPAPITSATQAIAEAQGPVAKAPIQAAPRAPDKNAVPRWQSRLQMIVERNKRYPVAAQARRETGIVEVSFVMDRSGKLLSSRVERSSGHAALDHEATELLTRAQPFPVPPPEMPGAEVRVTVAVRFNLR